MVAGHALLCLSAGVVLAGCGTVEIAGDASAAPSADPSAAPSSSPRAATSAEKERLLRHADDLAADHQGQARQVLAVLTMRSTAWAVTGFSAEAEEAVDEQVWVLHISGDDYFCVHCSGPSDEGKWSTHLTLTVRAQQLEHVLTYGAASTPYDLSAYGHVEELRPS